MGKVAAKNVRNSVEERIAQIRVQFYDTARNLSESKRSLEAAEKLESEANRIRTIRHSIFGKFGEAFEAQTAKITSAMLLGNNEAAAKALEKLETMKPTLTVLQKKRLAVAIKKATRLG